MDFLKKHWEKILLTVALVGLIFVSVWLMLKIDSLQQDVNQLPARRAQKGEMLTAINQGPYTNGIHQLENPVLWTDMPQNPFEHPRDLPPPPPSLDRATNEFPISFVRVQRIPFKMLFKAYTWDAAKAEAGNFQLDFAFRPLTLFVSKAGDTVSSRFENTGYIATAFERKIVQVSNPSLGVMVDKDVSVLTIQRPKEQPIKLMLGEFAEEREPVAWLACDPGWPAKRQTYQVRRGQRFECAGVAYIVVDITPRQVLIKNANKPEEKPITIELATSASPAFP